MANPEKPQKKTTHGGRRAGAGRKKANGRVLLTVRVEPELRARLQVVAGRLGCSLTEVVESALESYLRRQKREIAVGPKTL